MSEFMVNLLNEQLDMRRNVYKVPCHCRNCGWTGNKEFKRGTRVPQFMECPRCETNEVRKS